MRKKCTKIVSKLSLAAAILISGNNIVKAEDVTGELKGSIYHYSRSGENLAYNNDLLKRMFFKSEDDNQEKIKSSHGNYDVKTAILHYKEEGRVSTIEPVISITKHIDTDESINAKFTFDSLSGASATGAIASSKNIQTFTSPSGTYKIEQGQTPVREFQDTRIAFTPTWSKQVTRPLKMILGANISTELDYRSYGANSVFNYDINDKNTTIGIGASIQHDEISPISGFKNPFSLVQTITTSSGGGSGGYSKWDTNRLFHSYKEKKDKNTFDALFGITQVIDEKSLFQVNYTFSQSNGYLTDPYKMISIVDSKGGVLIEHADPSRGINAPIAIYENRPDNRQKHAGYFEYRRAMFDSDVFAVSFRYMRDDWNIKSKTYEAKYKFKFTGKDYLQPHIRYYSQTKAKFYTPYLAVQNYYPDINNITARNPEFSYASADYRLADMNTLTLGLEYGKENIRTPWSISFEYYRQYGKEPAKFGYMNNIKIFPTIEAYMTRLKFDF